MFERLIPKLLHPEFFSQSGERGWRFDPHWPGPLIGQAGSAFNFAWGAVAIVLLVILWLPRPSAWLGRIRLVLSALCTIGVPLALAGFLGWNAWWIAGASLATLLVAWSAWQRASLRLLALGRLAAALLLAMVLSGTLGWNVMLGAAGLVIVISVYLREGKSVFARIALGTVRAALIAFVLILLNSPQLTLSRTNVYPSVVAILLDNTLSMSVRDVNLAEGAANPSRIEAAITLLTGDNQALLRDLAKTHSLELYSFTDDARKLGQVKGAQELAAARLPDATPAVSPALVAELQKIPADGQTTQVVSSLLTVLNDLQGRQLAGVVILTDGRDTPTAPLAEAYKQLAAHHVKVYPIAVGSTLPPKNIELQAVNVQDSAFKDDIVNVRLQVRATGYEPGHAVKLRLTDKLTGKPLLDPDGKPAEKTIHVASGNPVEEELLIKPTRVGPLDIVAEAEKQPGEVDDKDNIRQAQIEVLDAKITVLYVEGYPRWEYRYIKNEMIRDKTVNISCLLTSADFRFIQEHTDMAARGEAGKYKYFPYSQFPLTLEQLMECDVVLLGDVNPAEQFSDKQLQMIAEFVSKKGGGFGMIAGPHYSPQAYRNTPIESVLPVNIGIYYKPTRQQQDEADRQATVGFRLEPTQEGWNSSIFRFQSDRERNEKYIKETLQPLYWYARGVTVKEGVGEVYAVHPTDLDADHHKAPLLVLGRYGAGRTLFSAYDESWRWRFYTGESVFDSYWVQQLRYLARSKKLGQRKATLNVDRTTYELGEHVHLTLHVMNPELLEKLPSPINVQVLDANGQVVKTEPMEHDKANPDTFTASFAADRVGQFTVKLPETLPEGARLSLPLEVIVPRLELAQPQVDSTSLSRLAEETGGQEVKLEEARARLASLIPSATIRETPPPQTHGLWDTPAALIIFAILLTTEWVLRKAYGMV